MRAGCSMNQVEERREKFGRAVNFEGLAAEGLGPGLNRFRSVEFSLMSAVNHRVVVGGISVTGTRARCS